MKHRLLSLLMFALPLFIFSSCDKEELPGGEQNGADNALRFDISIGTNSATPQLKSVTNPDFTSVFENGDQIGLYIVKGSGGLQSSANWVDNMPMTFNGTGWDYTLPAGKEYFPNDGSTLSFYAYYPYNATLNNPLSMAFAVQADQSTAANFSLSDLMMASQTGVAKSRNPIPLTFSHKLAMVEVKVTNGSYDGAIMSNMVKVALKGCETQATANLANGSVTASGTAPDIAMLRTEQPADNNYTTSYTYRVLVPAQSIVANNDMIAFTCGNTLTYKPAAGIVLNNGDAKSFNITLNPDAPDPNHVYAIGDFYPHKGLAMGVVYTITNGGKDGKIVSLDEAYLLWGPMYVATGATNFDDGSANMATVKSLDATFADYPAFAWCALHGGGWYMPAMNELLMLRNADNGSVFNTVNTTLDAQSWTILRGNGDYWSSTDDNGNTYLVSFGLRTALSIIRDNAQCIRAVRTF